MRQPPGKIIQEAPLAVWANLRQRALDTAITEINKKTNLNIALESLGRLAPGKGSGELPFFPFDPADPGFPSKIQSAKKSRVPLANGLWARI
jgi:hypothetical protein